MCQHSQVAILHTCFLFLLLICSHCFLNQPISITLRLAYDIKYCHYLLYTINTQHCLKLSFILLELLSKIHVAIPGLTLTFPLARSVMALHQMQGASFENSRAVFD